jgi:hypothetical protein
LRLGGLKIPINFFVNQPIVNGEGAPILNLHVPLAFGGFLHKIFFLMVKPLKCGGVVACCLTCLLALNIWAGEAEEPQASPPESNPAPSAGTKEKTAVSDTPLTGVDWDALNQSFAEEQHAMILSGSAWMRYKGIKLEADNIVLYRQTHEIYAEGHVRLRLGESELSGEVLYLDASSEEGEGYIVDASARLSGEQNMREKLAGKEPVDEKKEADRQALNALEPKSGLTSVYRYRDPYGTYLEPKQDPQSRSNMVLKASKIVKHGKLLFSADDAFVTNDDMAHPMYGHQSSHIDFYLTELPDPKNPGQTNLAPDRVVAKAGKFYILGVPVLPTPPTTYDFQKKNVFYQFMPGHSSRWGYFEEARIGVGLGTNNDKLFDPTHLYLDFDERTNRGPATGFEIDWQTGYRPTEDLDQNPNFERGQGHLIAYGIDECQINQNDALVLAQRNLERILEPQIDGNQRQQYDPNLLFIRRRQIGNAGPSSFSPQIHEDDFRGMVDLMQHQNIKNLAGIDNVQLDLKYQRESDRDFMLEYFPNNYMTENQPEALASLRKVGDDYSVEFLYRANPQDFDGAPPRSPVDFGTFTGYEPALTYSLSPTPLSDGFFISGETQMARMTRFFERDIYNQPGFNAGRAYTNVDLTRPFQWNCLNFVPHLGTQQQGYTGSNDGSAISQGALTYGFDITSRLYGTFPDVQNPSLGIDGLRQIIEPRLSFAGIGDTREDPVKVYDFDQIDDLRSVDKLNMAIDQTFQTRRQDANNGLQSTVDVAAFDLNLDYYPRRSDQLRLLDGDCFYLLEADGYLRVNDIMKLNAAVGLNVETSKMETAVYGLTLDPGTRWKISLEERYDFSDPARAINGSDQIGVKVFYQLSERWGASYEVIEELRPQSILQNSGTQVQRYSLTRSYGAFDVSFTYSEDRNLNDHSIFGTIRPMLAYRNLVVPKQDLLVAAGEVSGEPEQAPEETNYDPFDLLKRHKANKKPAAPPPTKPASSDDTSAITPPAAASNSAPDQTQANQPPAKPASKVDEDDWTAPAPVPTSAR